MSKIQITRHRRILLLIGSIVAIILLISKSTLAQDIKKEAEEYVCTPCGCEGDTEVVHAPGKCGTCGMGLINLTNPSAGLKYTNIWPAQLCQLLDKEDDILLLDVRSEAEYNAIDSRLSRFKNAINIPIAEIRDRLDELEKYKDKKIVVHCSISARSTRVSQTLSSSGFVHIYNLLGGLNYWVGRPDDELPCKQSLLEKGK